MDNSGNKLNQKVSLTFWLFISCFLIIFVKAVYVQVIARDKLLAYARGQFFRQKTIYTKRGNIFDRNGHPLAINVESYSIFTIPRSNGQLKKDLNKLSKIIPELDYKDLYKKISKRRRYTWVARKIKLNEDQLESINKIENIFIEPEPGRYYPNNTLFSQGLGFVGVDNIGLSGIEFNFDNQLRGKEQIIKYIQDAKGRAIKFERVSPTDSAEDIYLSIDKNIQDVAEKALKIGVEKSKALRGGIGVLNPETGEILAMANYPTFDPNEPTSTQGKDRKLAFVSDPFEPGSIFKIFTVASALENNIADSQTHYFCENGKFKVEDHIIKEAHPSEKFEWLSVKDIIRLSSNIGVTKMAFDITFPTLKSTLKKFGIGEKTDIEFPGESRGIFPAGANVGPLKLSNLSFGQGVATTGIQMLSAYGAIANGGVYVKPTIIKREKGEKITGKRILSEKVVASLVDMLTAVIDDGTGSNAKIPFFQMAGKTGTAQKAAKGKGYVGHIASFIGMPFNVEKKFVIFVYIDGPSTENYYGNSVAAPVFKRVAQYILYKNKAFRSIAMDHGDWANRLEKWTPTPSKIKRFLGKGLIPDFKGLDKLTAKYLANRLGVDLKQNGVGLVYSQYPQAGETVMKNDVIELNFRPPTYE